MDLFIGYAGVAVTFIIMMSVLLLMLIKANNISWKLKAVVIPFVLWYSVALYHVPSNFMGWPTEKWSIDNEVILLSWQIVENKAMYFWVIDYNIKNVRKMFDARNAFFPYIDDTPRAYKVEYNSEIHEQLLKAQAERDALGRGGIMMQMDMLSGMTAFNPNKPLFEIFDPAEVLSKGAYKAVEH